MVSISLLSGPAVNGSFAAKINIASDQDSKPASLQWTLQYNTDVVNHIEFALGPQAAGKRIACSTVEGQTTCVLWGPNKTVLSDGTVAVATVHLNGGSNANAVLNLVDGSASSSSGDSIRLEGLVRPPREWPPLSFRSELMAGAVCVLAAIFILLALCRRIRRYQAY